jgi:hypothetical protein
MVEELWSEAQASELNTTGDVCRQRAATTCGREKIRACGARTLRDRKCPTRVVVDPWWWGIFASDETGTL